MLACMVLEIPFFLILILKVAIFRGSLQGEGGGGREGGEARFSTRTLL